MSLRESIVEAACSRREQAKPLLLVMAMLAALTVFSLLSLEPNTAAYNIALVDVGILAVGFVLFGGTFWYCTRRGMDDGEAIGKRYREGRDEESADP